MGEEKEIVREKESKKDRESARYKDRDRETEIEREKECVIQPATRYLSGEERRGEKERVMLQGKKEKRRQMVKGEIRTNDIVVEVFLRMIPYLFSSPVRFFASLFPHIHVSCVSPC